jgi:hypothetical protein
VFEAPRLSDDEVHFRNLYKAGQRRVADARRKRKEKLRLYNNKKFNQLELPLVTVPDQKEWLLNKLRG